MRQLVYNAVKCMECGEVLVSYHGHDYKTCKCPQETMVDGGVNYARYGGVDLDKIEHLHVYLDEDFMKVREYAHWGNRGKDGLQPLTYLPLSEMSNAHLTALLDYGIIQWYKDLVIKELEYRKKYDIMISDKEIRKYNKMGKYESRKNKDTGGN